jgi:phosphoglycerate kinase
MAFRTLDHVNVADKRVLVRVDLNVPMKDGKVTDLSRIVAVAPTITELSQKGAKVILLAHFGRPKGGPDPQFSLAPVRGPLATTLDKPVDFAADCIGPVAEAAVADMEPGDILLLENTRFHPEEEKNDPAFVAALAKLGDVYVNDAFSAAHRAHASTEGLAHKLPAYAGRSMEKEISALEKALANPERPLVAVVGGAKVSTKIELLQNLVEKVDALIIGGAMANTFLLAKHFNVGKSLAEPDHAGTARRIMSAGERSGHEVVLPVDAVVARELAPNVETKVTAVGNVPDEMMILDIGPVSIGAVNAWFDKARTLVWNGPLGAFETPPFDKATVATARHAATLTRARKLLSVAGGGDTVAALNAAGVAGDFSYVSTAGGAFLEWLEGKALPGVEALRAK